MRFRHAIFAACGLALASVAIIWSGARLENPEPAFEPDPADIAAELVPEPEADEPEITAPAAPEPPTTTGLPPPDDSAAAEDVAPSPPVEEPEATANAQPPAVELERLPARAPLSDLAAPQKPAPPPTKMPDEWKSTRLFKPVASSAGTIEAQGYRIALAGVQPVATDEKCTIKGKEWPCGLQARTAFRSWLRGRAIACVVPPEPDQQLLVAECQVGKTDLSEWLVSNGWAKAAPEGPYAEAGRKASEARKGIYGEAPVSSVNLPRVADPAPMAFPDTGPAALEPEPIPEPIIQPPLTGPFPPAPEIPQ